MTTNVQFSHQNHEVHGVILSIGNSYTGLILTGIKKPLPVTHDILHDKLEEPSPLPLGQQKFLDLKTGENYHTKARENMSSRARGGGAELDLELNLSPPTVNSITESPTESLTTSPTSRSCLSLDLDSDKLSSLAYCSDSSSAVTPMVLVGCQRCLMYVMISKEVCLKCPKCKSTVLLDILHGKPKAVDDSKLDKKAS